MPKVYSWRLNVRTYDLDPSGFVRTVSYLHYLEEGAVQASASLGYPMEWYWQNNRIWVLRKMTLRYHSPARYGEELELRTWVSDTKRVQSHRDYDLRKADGTPVLRGRGNWAFVNTQTMLPERIPPQAVADFEPVGTLEPLNVAIPDPQPVEFALETTSTRRVQQAELDYVGHVNNAVYFSWAEQSLADQLREVGCPADLIVRPLTAEMEYLRSAQVNEPIRTTIQLAQTGTNCALWLCEITHSETNDLLARASLAQHFATEQGPCAMPESLYDRLTVSDMI